MIWSLDATGGAVFWPWCSAPGWSNRFPLHNATTIRLPFCRPFHIQEMLTVTQVPPQENWQLCSICICFYCQAVLPDRRPVASLTLTRETLTPCREQALLQKKQTDKQTAVSSSAVLGFVDFPL